MKQRCSYPSLRPILLLTYLLPFFFGRTLFASFDQNKFISTSDSRASSCPQMQGNFQWMKDPHRKLIWSITQHDCTWFTIEVFENKITKGQFYFNLSGQKWLVRQNQYEQLWGQKIRQSPQVLVFRFEIKNQMNPNQVEVFDRRLVLQILDSKTALLRDQYGQLTSEERFIQKTENVFIRSLTDGSSEQHLMQNGPLGIF